MDRVRFGRALGSGARDAARAVVRAADAAAAPSQAVRAEGSPREAAGRRPEVTLRANAAERAAKGAKHVQAVSTGLKRGSKGFGEAVWRPVVKVSGIVWLEVTGVLFSLFAIAAAAYLWQHRGDLHAAGTQRQNLFLALGMLALFGFFTISSFVRARQRSRR